MKYLVCVLTAVTLLGACGGGGGGSDGAPGSWAGLRDQALRLGEEWANTDYTEHAQMRQSGTATYRGVAEYGMYVEDGYVAGGVLSSAEMQANFSDASISGRLHNFQAYDRTPISGEVAIRDGVITGAEYAADLAGELSANGQRAAVSGSVYGDFSGAQAEMVDGYIDMMVEYQEGAEYLDGFMVLRQ